MQLGDFAEAEAAYRQALALDPRDRMAHLNRIVALATMGRSADAAAAGREAVRSLPHAAEVHVDIGSDLMLLHRLAEAEAVLRESLQLYPDSVTAHVNLSHTLLLGGRLAEGWREYEWRWSSLVMGLQPRAFAQPAWSGESLAGRTLLIHAEQGLGDTLQFCRFVPPLAALGARVVIEAQPPLARLLRSLPGVAAIVAAGDPLPDFDLHLPLMSLPLRLGVTLDTLPGPIPYLEPEPAAAAHWQQRLAALPGLRVGLVWAGGSIRGVPTQQAVDRRRSLELEQLAPLAGLAGVSFVSLQKGEPSREPRPQGLILHDWTDELDDFADTAALASGLDLVIAVDTSVAHLAGALGRPVWMLNRFDTCWRWLLGRDDSPWYPTLRQFRQPAPGDWGRVIQAVRAALVDLAGPAGAGG